MTDDKKNARHHWVQKAYLDRFAADEKIDVVARADGAVRANQLTKQVAATKGFYNHDNEDGTVGSDFEDALANEIEGPAMNVIGNLCSLFPYIPQGAQRSAVASYIALQYLRTPERRRSLEMQSDMMFKIDAFNLARDDEKTRRLLEVKGKEASEAAIRDFQQRLQATEGRYELVMPRNVWIKYIGEGIEHVYPILAQRFSWSLLIFDEDKLVTSDHPVVLRKIYPDGRAIGFMNADEILFPLSSRVALLLSAREGIEEVIKPQGEAHANSLAEMINNMVTRSSYLEFYCHPSLSKEFAGKPLGERAIFESNVPDGMPDFLKTYSQTPARPFPRR